MNFNEMKKDFLAVIDKHNIKAVLLVELDNAEGVAVAQSGFSKIEMLGIARMFMHITTPDASSEAPPVQSLKGAH